MRVNMDSSIAADPRFKVAARHLGLDWKSVIGSCFLVYLAAYERRSKCFSKIEADIAAEVDGFADALVAAGLATESDADTVEIHGVESRIAFLEKQRRSGAKGGKQSAKSRIGKPEARASRQPKHVLARDGSTASPGAQAYPLALTQSQSPDLSLSPDGGEPKKSAVEVVDQLWSELNAYQADLGIRVTPMSISSESMVYGAVRDFGVEEIRHTLRVLHRKAKDDPKEAKWLDGAKTWARNVIEFNRGETADTPTEKRTDFTSILDAIKKAGK